MTGDIEVNMILSFVEDELSGTIHVWLALDDYNVGVICEEPPTDGGTYKKLAVTEIQDEWFGRLCPLCFNEGEVSTAGIVVPEP